MSAPLVITLLELVVVIEGKSPNRFLLAKVKRWCPLKSVKTHSLQWLV